MEKKEQKKLGTTNLFQGKQTEKEKLKDKAKRRQEK